MASQNFKVKNGLDVGSNTATNDTISIIPNASTGTSYVGTLTPADLTAARTWTLPDSSGTLISGITAGSAITTSSTNGVVTVNHADTSSQASVDNSNGNVIQDITLDTYGHITGVGSVDLDGRYYTETEADTLFVNATGDSMTGNLSITSSSAGIDGILSVHNSTAGNSNIKFTNSSTGTTATDGMFVGIGTDGQAYVYQREALALNFGTSNATKMTLDASGNLAVTGTVQGTQLKSTIATGTSPLTVTSTTLVSNLNADLLDGMQSATANTASTIVARDISGNFSAGTITASLSGNATSASKVNSSETIKFDTGTTEGTDLYTFDGSSAKTIDIKAGTNVSLTKAAGVITINANDTSVDWSEIQNKPDPVITLAGDLTGSVTLTDLASGTLTATIAANSVALGTDTTGNYVAGVTQGTGISVTGTAGEGWTPVVSLTNVGTAGTYRSVTTDAQGRVTAGTNPTTLSGYGITDAQTASRTSATFTTAANTWYRIATSVVGIERNSAEFVVDWTVGGNHGSTRFAAACHYGESAGVSLMQTNYAKYGTGGITEARIVYHTTYTGNYAYVEVKFAAALTSVVVNVEMQDPLGWTLVTPSTAGSIPSGYISYVHTFVPSATITAGTYPKVTINQEGRVISGSAMLATDIPDLDANKITTGTLPVVRGGTGVTTSTGTGSVVLSTSPTLTTPNIGVATGTSFNSITGLASVAPIVAGTAAVGTSTLTARQDHVHPAQTTITGNAGTATTLQTARTIGASGDVTGTATSFNGSANITIPMTLANSGVTAGTYSKVTVDAKGRVTAGATQTMEDIPDATFKRSVRCATTANITLSGTQTIDGIAVVAGDRVLVKNQTTSSQNGIYVVNASTWTRSLDADSITEIASALVAVDSGTANGGKLFDNDFKTTDTLDTTAMTWSMNLDDGSLLTAGSTAIGMIKYNGTTAAAGQFDGGTTTPTGTTRLNYGGYFYPAFLNLSGSGDTTTASSHVFVETGSDGFVRPKTLANFKTEIFASPTLVTPNIGVATGTSFNSITGLSSTTPSMNGTAAVGTSVTVARADHVHATDTSRMSNSQALAITGDVTASSTALNTGTIATTLASVGTAGTYTKVTTDAKGRITSGTTLSASDIPTLNQNTTGSSGSCTGNAATATTATNLSGLTLNSSAAAINPDNVTQNQIGYNTNVSLFGQTDGGLYSSAYSSSWIHQIYGDFRSGQLAVRGKNNGTWQSWRTVLDSSNYNSYSPTLTGSGASGTWGINVTGNAATATTATNQSGGTVNATTGSFSTHVQATGTGNDYYTGGVELIGNGTSNTVFPNIGFHQPGLYASSLQLRGGGDFRFYAQGAGSYANVTAATFYGALSGGTVSATTGTFSGAVSVLSLTETSDRNFKDNIETLGTGLIDSIRPVSFNWKDGGKKAYGVIAQELEEVVPEAVVTSEEGVKSVQYTQLIPLLIAEVQALRNEINILKGAK